MNSRFSKAVAMIAGIHVLGGHWLALQMVAWMGMMAVNSQEANLASALEKTFDGKHPCPLCCAVEAGKQKEKEQQQKQFIDSVNKVNALPLTAFVLPVRGESAMVYFETTTFSDAVAIHPPTPPPWWV